MPRMAVGAFSTWPPASTGPRAPFASAPRGCGRCSLRATSPAADTRGMDYEVLVAALAVVGVLLWIHRDLKKRIDGLDQQTRDALAGRGETEASTQALDRIGTGEDRLDELIARGYDESGARQRRRRRRGPTGHQGSPPKPPGQTKCSGRQNPTGESRGRRGRRPQAAGGQRRPAGPAATGVGAVRARPRGFANKAAGRPRRRPQADTTPGGVGRGRAQKNTTAARRTAGEGGGRKWR